MPLYVLNRNYTLRSTYGRIVNFVKGEPVWVVPEVEKEALTIGAQPTDGPKDVLDPEILPDPPLSPDEREAKYFAAFKKLETRNERGDFSGQGLPALKIVQSLVGFQVDVRERDTMWRKYKKLDEQ